MDKVPAMKTGKDKQISYRSIPEIVGKLDLAAAKLAVVEKFDGVKLRTGHIVNAIALWIGTLDDDELRRFVIPKLRAYEAYMASVDSVDTDVAEMGEEGPPLPVVSTKVTRTGKDLDRDNKPQSGKPKGAYGPTRRG